MSSTDRVEDETLNEIDLASRDDPDALYTVFKKEWYVLEDHEGEHVISCEYPYPVEVRP